MTFCPFLVIPKAYHLTEIHQEKQVQWAR